MVYIAIIIGLFAFIYLATISHWAVIAFLVGVALFIYIWLVWNKKRKATND